MTQSQSVFLMIARQWFFFLYCAFTQDSTTNHSFYTVSKFHKKMTRLGGRINTFMLLFFGWEGDKRTYDSMLVGRAGMFFSGNQRR